MIGNLVKELKRLEVEKEEVLEVIHTYLTNKEIPIDIRWEVFMDIDASLPIANHIDDFTYKMLGHEASRGIYWYSWVEDVDNYDLWRELALATGTAGFEQDW